MTPIGRFALILGVGTSVACGNLNSIHRKLDVSVGKGALIDIKQRAILVRKTETGLRVCAEPSPDALSAYAAELSAQASEPDKITAALGVSTKEAASFVGLRTQSIQLLRDGFYRGCEAFLNEALRPEEYAFLTRRYQKYMVALLAIEQLTGAVQATASAPLTPSAAVPSGSTPAPSSTPTPGKPPTPDASPAPGDTTAPSSTPAAGGNPAVDSTSTTGGTSSTGGTLTKGSTPKKGGTPKKGSTSAADGAPATGGSSATDSTPSAGASKGKDITVVAKVIETIVLKILETDDKTSVCFAFLSRPTKDQEGPLVDICKKALESGDIRLPR